jgi:hypothetical protein
VFIDQLEELEFPVHVDGTRNQPDFNTIRSKTLSEMEEDLDKLLEITKQETIVDGKILSSGCQQDIIQAEQPVNTVSTTTIENYLKNLTTIQCPNVDNFELLEGIDKVSDSIAGCINLA